jgi:hypothetical protein
MIVLRRIVLIVCVAASGAPAAEGQGVPTPSPAQGARPLQTPPMPPSPIEHFRQILAMNPEQRGKAMASRSAKTREILEAKLKEYEALPPEERENRLRTLELRWRLVPLLKMAPSNRITRLETVPARDRRLIEDRLLLWDKLPPESQREVLECEPALSAFVGPDTRVSASGMGSPLTPQKQEQLNKSTTTLNSLPPEKREEVYRNFREFFELSERERSRALDSIDILSEAERKKMELTLQSFEKLPPEQREQCIAGFQKFTALSPEERDQFLRSAARWEAMSPRDRQIWRSLVARKAVPQPPPLPPGAGVGGRTTSGLATNSGR